MALSPGLFWERYRAAFNALIRSQQPTHEWLAGIVIVCFCPSQFLFEITYDPFSTSILPLQRDCIVEALGNFSGPSPFADDMVLHSDGADAIPAMRVMVNAGGDYLQWLGFFVNMLSPTYRRWTACGH